MNAMKKFTEKEIRLAEKNIDYFNKLSPAEKLHITVCTAADDGEWEVRWESWKKDAENGAVLSKSERLEELIYILETRECRSNIDLYLSAGILELLIPELFSGMDEESKEKYSKYISGLGKVTAEDPIMFINLFMFPFRVELIESVFDGAGFDDDAVDWLLKAQNLYPEFMSAASVRGVRGFVYHHGLELFEYLKVFGDNLYLMTGEKKYRPVDSDDVIKKWKAQGGPYCMEDLNISDHEVTRIAQENGVEKGVLMEILMNYCLKHPQDNHEKILVFVAENTKGAKLKRALKDLEKSKQKNFI